MFRVDAIVKVGILIGSRMNNLTFSVFIKQKVAASLFQRARRRFLRADGPPRDRSVPGVIPRIVWIYWDKGEDAAPQLVRDCIASWRAENPGWRVCVLDDAALRNAVDLPELPADIPVQAFSDLLRLRLLKQNGGVWADATAFCLRPLDNWLPVVSQGGFFAFTWTSKDRWFLWPGLTREIGSWFLASEKEGVLISEWERAGFDYWTNRQKTDMYFWVHMIFEYLAKTSGSFRKAARAMPKISCFNAHLIYDCVERGVHDAEVVAALRAGAAPVQKLRWNWDPDQMNLAVRLLQDAGVPVTENTGAISAGTETISARNQGPRTPSRRLPISQA